MVRCVKCRKALVDARGNQQEAYKDDDEGRPWCPDCWREHQERPIEGERADAWDIWQDVKKQYADGKLSEEEYQVYRKRFEKYRFKAPSLADDKRLPFYAMFAIIGTGLALMAWWKYR